MAYSSLNKPELDDPDAHAMGANTGIPDGKMTIEYVVSALFAVHSGLVRKV